MQPETAVTSGVTVGLPGAAVLVLLGLLVGALLGALLGHAMGRRRRGGP